MNIQFLQFFFFMSLDCICRFLKLVKSTNYKNYPKLTIMFFSLCVFVMLTTLKYLITAICLKNEIF